MNGPRCVRWRHCAVIVVGLAVVTGAAAGWAIHAEAGRSVAAAQLDCRTATTRFARTAEVWIAVQAAEAAEGWISIDERQSFQRAVDLMLLGSATYVQVVVGDAVVADSVDQEWASNVPLHIKGSTSESDTLMMYSLQRKFVCDVVVPIGVGSAPPSTAPISYARVGYLLEALTSHLQTIRLAGAGIAFAAFLVACACAAAALAWLGHRGALLSPLSGVIRSFSTEEQAAGPLLLNEHTKQVALHGKVMFLPPKPFQLLSLLMREKGRVLPEDEVVATLWPEADLADSRDVRQCVYLLRKRLNAVAVGAGDCIVNVKGFGYRYDDDSLEGLLIEPEETAE